ncbi:MAG: ankyrin repeat domain-containing protein [Alphaproteobacteria bacterium]|nr:ankyrin repeat domain-containing protein [Alphaproteobacteria bacterium]
MGRIYTVDNKTGIVVRIEDRKTTTLPPSPPSWGSISKNWKEELSSLGVDEDSFHMFNEGNYEQILNWACENNKNIIIEKWLKVGKHNFALDKKVIDWACATNQENIIEQWMELKRNNMELLRENIVKWADKNNNIDLITKLIKYNVGQTEWLYKYIGKYIKSIEDFDSYKGIFKSDINFIIYLIMNKNDEFVQNVWQILSIDEQKKILSNIYREEKGGILSKTLLCLRIEDNGYKCLQDIFIWACKSDSLDIIQKLENYNAFNIDSEFNYCVAMRDAAGYSTNPQIIDIIYIHHKYLNKKYERNRTALSYAANFNPNPEVIEKLCDLGADVDAPDLQGKTPLFYALYNTNLEILDTLVKRCADVNQRDSLGRTALSYAANFNPNPEVIKKLCDLGANVNAPDLQGKTPLFYALYNTNLEILDTLVKMKAKVNQTDRHGRTALSYAANFNPNPVIIEKLYDLGADVNLSDNKGITPLMYASAYNDNPEIPYILIKLGAYANTRDKQNLTPRDWLYRNSQTRYYDKSCKIEQILKKGENKWLYKYIVPNVWQKLSIDAQKKIFRKIYGEEKDRDLSKTLLCLGIQVNDCKCLRDIFIWACKNNSLDAIEKLEKYKAFDIDAQFNYCTAMNDAAGYAVNPEIIEKLRDLGADINKKDTYGRTALSYAANFNLNPEIIEKLCDLGADVNMSDDKGITPLMYASAYNDNPEISDILIKLGADANTRDKQNLTARDWLYRNSKTRYYNKSCEIEQILIKGENK